MRAQESRALILLVLILAGTACTAETGALGLPPASAVPDGSESMTPAGDDDEPGSASGGGDETTPSADAGTSSGETRHEDAGTASSSDPDAGSTTIPDAGGVTQQLLVAFDAAQGELPRGLQMMRGELAVGFLNLGLVTWGPSSTRAIAGGAGGATNGIVRGADNSLYVAYATGGPATAATGVYFIDTDWSSAMLLASDPALVYPNGIVSDRHETVYVTDSVAGRIFKIGWDRIVQPWSEDPLLASSSTIAELPCGSLGAGFPIGVNGITLAMQPPNAQTSGSRLVVVNSERATVLSIPILPDGSAGAASVIAGPDCANLFGADGIRTDWDDTFVITVQVGAKLVRVRDDTTTLIPPSSPPSTSVLTSGGLLDGPAGIELRRDVDPHTGQRVPPTRAYVANSTMIAPPTMPRPGPSIVVVELNE